MQDFYSAPTITVTFVPATNTKGPRWLAIASWGGSVRVPFGYSEDNALQAARAARACLTKHGLTSDFGDGVWVCGYTQDGYIFTRRDNSAAIDMSMLTGSDAD